MKNIFIWVGIALVVLASVIGQFTGVSVASWIELAGFTVGLASCVVGILKGTEKKDWKLYVSIVGMIVGVALCVFAGIAESSITTLITAVAGLVVLIVSLLPKLLAKKSE